MPPEPASPPNQSAEAQLRTIQLRYQLAAPTFKTLCAIPPRPDRRTILHTACQATELRSLPMAPAEGAFFRHINNHLPITYPIASAAGPIKEPWHKAFLLCQLSLQCLDWPSKISAPVRKQLLADKSRIYNLVERVLRCLVDILGLRLDGRGIVSALDVLRSIKSDLWEGTRDELLQIPGIGPAKQQRLLAAGVSSVRKLAGLEFYHIERLLSRNPPFGQNLLHQLAGFPLLTLQVDMIGQLSVSLASSASDAPSIPNSANSVARILLGFENKGIPLWKKKHPWTTLVIEGEDGRLVRFWRGSVKRLEGGKELIVGLQARKDEQLSVSFACEDIVGTMVRNTCKASSSPLLETAA
ncbi:hypothetical protein CDD82_6004 [Ophiocordyceps australis]|uniref:SEC63 domain-containing protein n=1 Tax=Ophiocordyceps australis TaxID=1399860 RepID=A0A2C5ZMY0_9HYPO|nr:hypothetical protein CDD82_6004 [Ophiocordyceps australis]